MCTCGSGTKRLLPGFSYDFCFIIFFRLSYQQKNFAAVDRSKYSRLRSTRVRRELDCYLFAPRRSLLRTRFAVLYYYCYYFIFRITPVIISQAITIIKTQYRQSAQIHVIAHVHSCRTSIIIIIIMTTRLTGPCTRFVRFPVDWIRSGGAPLFHIYPTPSIDGRVQ